MGNANIWQFAGTGANCQTKSWAQPTWHIASATNSLHNAHENILLNSTNQPLNGWMLLANKKVMLI